VGTIFFLTGGLLIGVAVRACVVVFLRHAVARPAPVSLPVGLMWGLLLCILTLGIAFATRQVEKAFFYEDFGQIERALFAFLWMTPTMVTTFVRCRTK
jgi:hypothetical protein